MLQLLFNPKFYAFSITMSLKGSKGSQLDMLLLKAESYSNFILENQKRTKAINETKLVHSPPSKKRKALKSNSDAAQIDRDDGDQRLQQPPNLVGGKLLPYQREGLQWLLSLWENGLNGILADEMGLGKTIQIISLIAYLRHHNTAGPYLLAAPLATISNWVKEFKKWLPSCPVILYHGDRSEREEMRTQHLPVEGQKNMSFPVVITSFEICIIDRPFLERYVWQYIILDEGHRIKNRNCRLLRELKSIRSVSRLLLTGTPIQNSLEELWSLLNFCSPMIFDDLGVFKSWFGFRDIGRETKVEDIISTEEQERIVSKLHEILRPFVLRRLKSEVLKDRLAPKRDVVVYCGMSSLQREYYSMVLGDSLRENLAALGVEGAKGISQINVNMNLRKVCNHPFLFGDLRDSSGHSIRETNPHLLAMASGKFKLLSRMLPRLKAEGHKVLIFSQMTKVLDLLEDYLLSQGHVLERFDGTSKLKDRQASIDRFNDPRSGVFVFLLSTRAGGLGINLTAADTVILFDSDWNPHQDAQAQDRCHRIGQTKNVLSYRLLTTGSVEIDMMRRQISKKKLERLTIQGGDYRKAGQRVGGRGDISIEDLKGLLEDDVRNLHRRDREASEGGGETAQSSVSCLAKDISDEELDLVMDRRLLFGHLQPLTNPANSFGEQLSSSSSLSSSTVWPAAVRFNESEQQAIAEVLQPPDADVDSVPTLDEQIEENDLTQALDLHLPPSELALVADRATVPVEGDMYDIVVAVAGSGVLSSIQ